MGWLDDTVVLVTGAGSGLGRAKRFSPLERAIEPADYTGHYVLLASRANSLTVTGSVHNCDGGIGVRGRKDLER